MTTTTYNAYAASQAARTAAEMRLGQVHDQLERELEEAIALADEYASHLAEGGEAWKYPQPERTHSGISHGLARAARASVFDSWNETRERKSVTYPWGERGNNAQRWVLQEALLDSLGTPVKLAELVSTRAGQGKPTPSDVASAAWGIQVATRGELRVRKTKVDGKVAWLVREPREGDDLADLKWRDRLYSIENVVATDGSPLPEVLARPFKTTVHEYPEEVTR